MVTVIDGAKTGTATKPGVGAAPARSGGSSGGGSGGDDRKRGGGEDDRFKFPEHDPAPARYRIGLGVLFAGIVMMFLSLTIAYVTLALASGWKPLDIPASLWISTALILISSWTFERARRAWRSASVESGSRDIARRRVEDGSASDPKNEAHLALLHDAHRWLLTTLILGCGFIVSQLLAWRELVARGFYVASNSHSSFFYMLTGLHAIHIVGGIAALGYLLLRVRRRRDYAEQQCHVLDARIVSLEERRSAAPPMPRAAIDAGAIYWHFVDGLWIYVLLLLLWG